MDQFSKVLLTIDNAYTVPMTVFRTSQDLTWLELLFVCLHEL